MNRISYPGLAQMIFNGGKKLRPKYGRSSLVWPDGKTPVKNPKVAANVQAMHLKWREQFDQRQAKADFPKEVTFYQDRIFGVSQPQVCKMAGETQEPSIDHST